MVVTCHILIVLEMVGVNLLTFHTCSKKKYGNGRILLVLSLFTVFLTAVALSLLMKLRFYGNGNGLFVLIGFLYLIPLKYLYEESLYRIFIVMCSAWIYTMLAFSVSVHIGKLLPPAYFAAAALIVQSLLYLLTLRSFLGFVRKKFIYVLQNIPQSIKGYLQAMSLMWFATAIVVNFAFIMDRNSVPKIIALCCLAVNAALSFYMIYVVVKSSKSIETLQKTVYTDYLTELPNRGKLMEDILSKIENDSPFFILFMDLNQFKSVNDKYGHHVGDEYLKDFALSCCRVLSCHSRLYRISGDEFVVLSAEKDEESLIQGIRGMKWMGKSEFLGVSIGVSGYPKDSSELDELIRIADNRMYEDKRNRRKS